MTRVYMTVAYDGTRYHGSALHKEEDRTIEACLNRALFLATSERIFVISASRTDAGVHAKGAVFVFDTESRIPPDRFPHVLNRQLPPDIRVVESHEVQPSFHPRQVSSRKTYIYRILNSSWEDPLRSRYAWFLPRDLDADRMSQAGACLIVTHDFTSFCNVNSTAQTKVRTIYDLTVTREGDEIIISVTGNGFLYNMVRIIAGTLAQIGWGLRESTVISSMLEQRNRSAAGLTAPAKGLTLMSYTFEDTL